MTDGLLAKVAAGQPQAIKASIDRFGDLVWTLSKRATPTARDAEEATQEVFVELWRHAGRFDASASDERAFVAVVARRRLADRLRRQSSRSGAGAAGAVLPLDEPFVAAAVAGTVEPMPSGLRPALVGLADELAGEVSAGDGYSDEVVADRVDTGAGTAVAWLGWVVAAAALILAGTVWIPKLMQANSQEATSLADRRVELARNAPDAVLQSWMPFEDFDTGAAPEITGVTGDALWSEVRQEGFLRFTSLKANRVGTEQYQLWIIDERGLNQRVSGGVFDTGSATETIVPIRPGAPVKKVAAFAVTLEPAGGVGWTDFSRRVALAVVRPSPLRIKERRDDLEKAADSVKIAWVDYKSPDAKASPPEVKGVWGEVVWNETRQEGYMTFHDLPTSISGVEQYQVWIVDQRGPGQRVSGGVFDVKTSGEIIVPIKPALKIKGAESFAVTIEKPGGVVVSDLSRRVCIAKLGG